MLGVLDNLVLTFKEKLTGNYGYSKDALNKHFEFSVKASVPVKDIILVDKTKGIKAELTGSVTLEGLCDNAKIEHSSLTMDFFNQHALYYQINFKAHDKLYSYYGQKYLNLKQPLKSLTTLYGEIDVYNDRGLENSYTTLSRFEMKQLPKYLFSILTGLRTK